MPNWSNRTVRIVGAALLLWVGGASAPAGSTASAPIGAQAPVAAPYVGPDGMLVSAPLSPN
jgi:hypothetical protein